MPSAHQLTPRALSNLGDIWNYVAADNVKAANRVESAILSACTNLARHPLLGSKRTEITPLPVRFWTLSRFPNFIVLYRPETKPLQVVAVLRGKRNIKAVQEEPGTSS